MFLLYLPYVISLLLGYFLIALIFRQRNKISFFLHIFLAGGLGLGLSGHMTFLSFVIFDQLNPAFIIITNLVLLGLFLGTHLYLGLKNKEFGLTFKNLHWKPFIPIIVLILVAVPLWIHSHFYAFGGWDAWSTWNLKAKIMFLGGTHWKNLFDPLLWRASPHYPLLLPSIINWGWLFVNETTHRAPVFTAFTFSFMTVGLLYLSLKRITKSIYAILTPIALLTLPLFIKLSFSQYSDILVSYYLLASVFCLIMAKVENIKPYSFLSGLFIGLMGFAKSEGLLAAGILIALVIPYIYWKNNSQDKKKLVGLFLLGAALTLIPTALFYLFYSPGNQTVIDGLSSPTKPVTLFRAKLIGSFYIMELISPKWNGLWIILFVGILVSKLRSLKPDLIIIPIFLTGYFLVIMNLQFLTLKGWRRWFLIILIMCG